MTREQLAISVACLTIVFVAVIEFGPIYLIRLEVSPVQTRAVSPGPPDNPSIRKLACRNITPPMPGDIEVITGKGAVDNQDAALRLMCSPPQYDSSLEANRYR
jgi:hypothetical protein